MRLCTQQYYNTTLDWAVMSFVLSGLGESCRRQKILRKHPEWISIKFYEELGLYDESVKRRFDYSGLY